MRRRVTANVWSAARIGPYVMIGTVRTLVSVSCDELSERERFEAVFRVHYDAVLRFALRRADRESAADVAAETFAIAWRRLDRLPRAARLPWLLVVARNVLSNQHRADVREREKSLRAARDWRPATEDLAAQVAEGDLVVRAFQGLTARDREALLLVAWDNLPLADAARVAGASHAGFAMRRHRARRRLTVELSDLEHYPSPTPEPIEGQA